MMNSQEISYFARRAETERGLAAQAKDPMIARIHGEMAERYEMLAIGEEPRRLSRQATG